MKFIACTAILALVTNTVAFAPSSIQKVSTSTTSLYGTSSTGSSRGEFLSTLVNTGMALSVGVVANTAIPSPAYAGWATGPGSAVLDPTEAIIDEAILKSDPVQKALKDVAGYAALVKDMKNKLLADSQVNLGPVIRKEFDFSKLRTDLNTVNSAFDEETQRGTDRLIRVILQDLSELEVANTQKDGIPRSDIRVAKMAAKLDKLQNAFDDYLKFAG